MSRPVRIPSYRLHKPSGQAIVTIRGRMFYLGRFGSVESCSEYGRIIAEWQAGSPETPPASPTMPSLPADLTVAELFRSYFRHCQQYYVKNGEVTNQVTISAEGLRLTVRWNAWAGTVAVVTSIAASSIRWPLSARGGTLGRGSGAPGSAGSDGGRSRVAGTDIVSEESLTR